MATVLFSRMNFPNPGSGPNCSDLKVLLWTIPLLAAVNFHLGRSPVLDFSAFKTPSADVREVNCRRKIRPLGISISQCALKYVCFAIQSKSLQFLCCSNQRNQAIYPVRGNWLTILSHEPLFHFSIQIVLLTLGHSLLWDVPSKCATHL